MDVGPHALSPVREVLSVAVWEHPHLGTAVHGVRGYGPLETSHLILHVLGLDLGGRRFPGIRGRAGAHAGPLL